MLQIEINHGNSFVVEADRERAIAAASAVLDHTGEQPSVVYEEFKRQWEALDDYSLMSGLANFWIDAERAADVALTDGWHDTRGASCSLTWA